MFNDNFLMNCERCLPLSPKLLDCNQRCGRDRNGAYGRASKGARG